MSEVWDTRSLAGRQTMACFHTLSFIGTQSDQLIYMWSLAAFALQRQGQVVATETVQPMKSKLFHHTAPHRKSSVAFQEGIPTPAQHPVCPRSRGQSVGEQPPPGNVHLLLRKQFSSCSLQVYTGLVLALSLFLYGP